MSILNHRSAFGSYFFPLLTAMIVIGLSVFVAAFQDQNRDKDEFLALAKQAVALRNIQHFVQECRSERLRAGTSWNTRADLYICRWPDYKRIAMAIEKISSGLDRSKIEDELRNRLDRHFKISDQSNKSEAYLRAWMQMQRAIWALNSIRSYFFETNPRWFEVDPLIDARAETIYRFVQQRRAAKHECLDLMKVWPTDQRYADYIFGHFQTATDLSICDEAFNDFHKRKSIRYGGKTKQLDLSGSYSFDQTRYLVAGLEMLPEYLNERRLHDLTLPELAVIGEAKRKELDERRKYIAGSDMISLIEPLPQLPYIIALWSFLLVVPAFYLSAHFALARMVHERQLPKRKWIAFTLLPRSGIQRALNFLIFAIPISALALTAWCCTSIHFYNSIIDLAPLLPERSRIDDLSKILIGSPNIRFGTFESLSLDLYRFIFKDQSWLVRIGNRYFPHGYLVALAASIPLLILSLRSRRQCIALLKYVPQKKPSSPRQANIK